MPRIARVLVSYELLREMLHLPIAAEICTVRESQSLHHSFEIVVKHPDLNDVVLAEGQWPPIVTPTWRKNVPVEFIEWGQE